MVSAIAPSFMSALSVGTNDPFNSIPSRLNTLNPLNVNVTVYVPGRRLMIWYWPEPSVTVDRVFSMSTGLDASTVTPGHTAPDVSFTTPWMVAWAWPAPVKRARQSHVSSPLDRTLIIPAYLRV